MTVLPMITTIVGVLLITVLVVGILKFERGWSHKVRYCCQCRHSWIGMDRRCLYCRGHGRTTPAPSPKTPTHDWQGHMDTGPLRLVGDWSDKARHRVPSESVDSPDPRTTTNRRTPHAG